MTTRTKLSGEDATTQARIILFTYLHERGGTLYLSDIATTWFNYTLGGWKAMLCNKNSDDNLYYEVTYNNLNERYYVDEYARENHAEYDPREIFG